MFVGLHVMLAQATATEELAISMEEGEAWLKAAQNYMRHYNVVAQQKTIDFIALMGCTVAIYGPRVGAIMVNRSKKKDAPAPIGHNGGPPMDNSPQPSHVSMGTAHAGLHIVPDAAPGD